MIFITEDEFLASPVNNSFRTVSVDIYLDMLKYIYLSNSSFRTVSVDIYLAQNGETRISGE